MTKTIGKQLKEARESKGISIEQAADEIHIRERYLLALENDDLAQIPSEIQAKGFLRLYAEFLEITLLPCSQQPEIIAQPVAEQMEESITPSVEAETADVVSDGFGQHFRSKRQLLGRELHDIQSELRINQEYLQAIEQENLALLPPAPQAKGLIERYADYLDLDQEEIVGLYADLLMRQQAQNTENTGAKKQKSRKVDGVRQIITPDLVIGFILIAIILFIGFLSIRQIMQTRSDISSTATEQAMLPAEAATQNTPTPTMEQTALNDEAFIQVATATLPLILPQDGEQAPQASRIIVQMIANQRAYLRVVADDEIVYEGRVIPGNIYEFFGDREIIIVTGNASAFDITLIQDNQTTQLGRLGLVGEILDITFRPDTIITPTPLPTQTPTVTNTPQITSTPTATMEPEE